MGALIGFFLGPIGRWFGAALAVLALVMVIYNAGIRNERTKWKAAVAAEKLRQEQVIKDVLANADKLHRQNILDLNELEKKVAEYAEELAKRPADKRCVLSPADAKRLQSIR